ncbi:hypothetical protein PUR58_00480, partial [Streptomyces sp. JV186]|uniref:hypothetical protein n=1 Tax=Streptomyces sp. JV186 TaxID=858639 RepID=UPI002E7901F6
LPALDERPHPDHPAVPRGLATAKELLQALSGTEASVRALGRGAVYVHYASNEGLALAVVQHRL